MGNSHPNGIDPDGGDFRAGLVGAAIGAVVGAATAAVYDYAKYGEVRGKDVLIGAGIGALAVGLYVGANYDLDRSLYTNRSIDGWYLEPHAPKMALEMETIGKANSDIPQGANTPGGFNFNTNGGGSVQVFWNHFKPFFPWKDAYAPGLSNDITTATYNGNTMSSGQKRITDPVNFLPGKGRIDLKGTGVPGTSSGTVRVQSATNQARWKFKVKQARLVKIAKWKFWR